MHSERRPVDVIALCSSGGQIRPLRLRMEDEHSGPFRVDIDEVVSTRQITYVGVEAQLFLCRATVWGREWLFELRYVFRTHRWQLVRRIH